MFVATYARGGRPNRAARPAEHHAAGDAAVGDYFQRADHPAAGAAGPPGGVRYRPVGATALLRRNVWLYGVGGMIAPFIGIKLVDLVVHNLLGA
jgi:hypothetical protein